MIDAAKMDSNVRWFMATRVSDVLCYFECVGPSPCCPTMKRAQLLTELVNVLEDGGKITSEMWKAYERLKKGWEAYKRIR